MRDEYGWREEDEKWVMVIKKRMRNEYDKRDEDEKIVW